MRTLLLIVLLFAVSFAPASFKDPRKNLKTTPEQTQDQVAKEQGLQKVQGQVGSVPEKTDDSGYVSDAPSDPSAASLIAKHSVQANSDAAQQVLKNKEEAIKSAAAKPRKTVMGAFWALFAGAILAFGVWAGLQKFGPKPPENMRSR